MLHTLKIPPSVSKPVGYFSSNLQVKNLVFSMVSAHQNFLQFERISAHQKNFRTIQNVTSMTNPTNWCIMVKSWKSWRLSFLHFCFWPIRLSYRLGQSHAWWMESNLQWNRWILRAWMICRVTGNKTNSKSIHIAMFSVCAFMLQHHPAFYPIRPVHSMFRS